MLCTPQGDQASDICRGTTHGTDVQLVMQSWQHLAATSQYSVLPAAKLIVGLAKQVQVQVLLGRPVLIIH